MPVDGCQRSVETLKALARAYASSNPSPHLFPCTMYLLGFGLRLLSDHDTYTLSSFVVPSASPLSWSNSLGSKTAVFFGGILP